AAVAIGARRASRRGEVDRRARSGRRTSGDAAPSRSGVQALQQGLERPPLTKGITMLACRIHAREDLRIEPQDAPVPGPGEVLLALGAGGICGSDLHYFFEGRNGSFVVREPLIPGHEASAVVVATGPGVTRAAVGDKVAVSP